MKTATVRDLRNHYSGVLKWIEAGEEVRITRRGKAVARLVPEPHLSGKSVDWSQSPAVLRERRASERMSAATAHKLLGVASGVVMQATHFFTFDKNQARLARKAGMQVPRS